MVKKKDKTARTSPKTESSEPQMEFGTFTARPSLPEVKDIEATETTVDETHVENGTAANSFHKKHLYSENDETTMQLLGIELFKQQIHVALAQHGLAAKHMGARQFWFFSMPQAILNMIGGILAFLATTEDLKYLSVLLSTIVGSISFVVVFLQTIATQAKYDVNGEQHRVTAIDLRDLREDLENTANRKFVMKYRNHLDQTDEEQHGDNATIEKDFDNIQKRYAQSLKACKSSLPAPIKSAFDMLDSEIGIYLSKHNRGILKQIYPHDYNNVVYFAAVDSLTAKFTSTLRWALFFPNPTRAVEQTMAEVQEKFDKMMDQHNQGIKNPGNSLDMSPVQEMVPVV